MIFKIIFIIFLIGLLVVGFSAAKFISIFREGAKLFREQAKGSAQQRQHHRNTTQTVVDHRDADEINKKIFKKDEGEYVEFEEEPVETKDKN